jgi:uncharacterized protein YecE (DUF72 family)
LSSERPLALIGTAGWSLPRAEQPHFPAEGTHLERYATRFPAAEINSSFHRSHRTAIWARWRDAVPAEFRFSVKMPKTITHIARLEKTDQLVAHFIGEAETLESKLACLLVQLPPSLGFDPSIAGPFLEKLRARTPVAIACEPRHASWFKPAAEALLADLQIARVAADPACVPAAGEPGGWRGLSYYRLHGAPKIYYSAYSAEFIATLSARLQSDLKAKRVVWCIFDNTTLGAATRNALDLSASTPAPTPLLRDMKHQNRRRRRS